MNQEHVLVEHLSNINSVLKNPLQLTQRIKFTCFDVSQSYIVFGATSGGLYIFNRYPHAFIKLIPSKHGSVVQVSISRNERNIAITSSRGLVIVIQNCFTETNFQYQVYSEHDGNLVTAMKWNSDNLYCGDNKGKVSVVPLPNLLSKAIFQTPCASLMQLDSNIVQIDCYSKFLLISTYTRTYVCDTDKEQYRQIGKRLRDGNFGACFFARELSSELASVPTSTTRGFFKNMKDDEQFASSIAEGVKIFCARPGARMWEANLDASVARTHQFKNFLMQEPSNIINIDDSVDAHLKISRFSKPNSGSSDLLNFSKVFVLGTKYIFTFNSDRFYIFDPDTEAVICSHFNNTKDVKIVKQFIYVWNDNAEIRVIALYDLEKLILQTLFNKQYYISSELCVNYLECVLNLVETSEKIHLVAILKEKLLEAAADHLLEKLGVLFEAIREFSEKKFIKQKSLTGIVVVNNSYVNKDVDLDEPTQKDQQLPETLQTLKDIGATVTGKLTKRTKNIKEKLQILEATVKNLTINDVNPADFTKVQLINECSTNSYPCNSNCDVQYEELPGQTKIIEEPTEDLDTNIKIFSQQYEWNKIHHNVEISKFSELLSSNSPSNLVKLFENFMKYMLEKNIDDKDIKLWCFRQYLKYLSKIDFQWEIENSDMGEYFLTESFCGINFLPKDICTCLYPLPSTKNKIPDYYEVGCAIFKKIWNKNRKSSEKILKSVPFMWKYIIKELRNKEDITILLPLLIQFGDEDLIAIFLDKFKYDTWDSAVQMLIKLKKRMCINCDNSFDTVGDIINWTTVGTLMVQSIGGPSAVNLLMRYASCIPSDELDCNFYQSCIFATAADNYCGGLRNEVMHLTKMIQSDEDSAQQFDKIMSQYLRKRYRKGVVSYSKNGLKVEKTDTKCTFCDLPIEIPLVTDNVKLKCSHVYHVICLKYNKGICQICKE